MDMSNELHGTVKLMTAKFEELLIGSPTNPVNLELHSSIFKKVGIVNSAVNMMTAKRKSDLPHPYV